MTAWDLECVGSNIPCVFSSSYLVDLTSLSPFHFKNPPYKPSWILSVEATFDTPIYLKNLSVTPLSPLPASSPLTLTLPVTHPIKNWTLPDPLPTPDTPQRSSCPYSSTPRMVGRPDTYPPSSASHKVGI